MCRLRKGRNALNLSCYELKRGCTCAPHARAYKAQVPKSEGMHRVFGTLAAVKDDWRLRAAIVYCKLRFTTQEQGVPSLATRNAVREQVRSGRLDELLMQAAEQQL